jgi:hypothetical protein
MHRDEIWTTRRDQHDRGMVPEGGPFAIQSLGEPGQVLEPLIDPAW